MKRFIIFVITIALILSVSIPAFAATPKLSIPKIPTAPTIKVEVKLSENFLDNWFTTHPLKTDWTK